MKAEAIYSLLVIDDQPTFFDRFFKLSPKFEAKYETNLEKGIATLLHSADFDAVLLDLAFSDQDSVHEGLEKLPEWIGACPCPVIIVSNHDHIRTYQAALHVGAAGYLFKKKYTADVTHWQQYIENTIKRCASVHSSQIQARGLYSETYLAVERKFVAFHDCNKPILLSGESGVGKGKIIERLWRDAFAPMHEIIEVSLLQLGDKPLADVIEPYSSEDIIYWRDLEKLSANGQIKLLKLLNNKACEGSSRWFFSTTKSLQQLKEAHFLLPNLAQCFEGGEVWIPPLRDRSSEVPDWLQLFLTDPITCPTGTRFFNRMVQEVFAPEVIEILRQYLWPGNIRELRAVIQISIAEAEKENEDRVSVDALPDRIKRYSKETRTVQNWPPEQQQNYEALGRIQRALNEASQKWEEAAFQLGLSGVAKLKKMLRAIYRASPSIFTRELCKRYGFEYGFYASNRILIILDENCKDILKGIEPHLKMSAERYPIEVNNSINFNPGDNMAEVLSNHLGQANIVLLLMCSNLFANHADLLDEVLFRKNDMKIIPIYARPCNWRSNQALSALSHLPTGNLPISEFSSSDRIYLDIVQGIEKTLDTFKHK